MDIDDTFARGGYADAAGVVSPSVLQGDAELADDEVREVRALGRRADREARARWWAGRGWGGSSLRAAFRLLEFPFPSRRMGQGGAHAIPPDEGSCWDWGGDPGG